MRNLTLFLPCDPPTATAQQKRHTRSGRSYDPANVKDATSFLTGLLSPHIPMNPIEGAIQARIRFVFPYRKSEKKLVVSESQLIPRVTRPDCSNLVKRLEDILERLRFFNDDSQIYSSLVQKYYGPEPGIHICLRYDE